MKAGRSQLARDELEQIDGFVTNIRYRSLTRDGWLLSLSDWRDEKALIRWRTQAQHHQSMMDILSHNIENVHSRDFEDHFKKTLTSLAKHRDMAKSIATTLGVSLP